MSKYLDPQFWSDQFDPAVRSAAAGFLTGAGIGSAAGDFAALSLDALAAGGIGAATMFFLSYVGAVAFGPTNDGPG